MKYQQLDISDKNSIEKFKTYIETEHNGFDVLVQNAGYKQAATDAFDIAAKQTLMVNFWGTLNMMKRKLMSFTVTVNRDLSSFG